MSDGRIECTIKSVTVRFACLYFLEPKSPNCLRFCVPRRLIRRRRSPIVRFLESTYQYMSIKKVEVKTFEERLICDWCAIEMVLTGIVIPGKPPQHEYIW